MAAVTLPKGWERWPESARLELKDALEQLVQERKAGKVPWRCQVPDCDGRPHKGRQGPHARAEQLPPADDVWDVWNLLAGRGFGKTRTGAEWVIEQARSFERGALVGPTAADVRDIMVEGESGILACARSGFRPEYQPSKRKLVYPNGSVQHCYSADEPDRLRGPQHHYFWCIAAGVPVLTEHGWVPVENVRDGELVATRGGLLPSTGAVRTKRDAELVEVVTESGARVVCTPDHRIATGPTTWAEARNLTVGDTIVVWNSPMDRARPRHGLSGAADVTTTRRGATTGTAGDGCFTGTSGLLSTGRSRTGMSSTTLITSSPTTGSTISSASHRPSTSGITPLTGTRPGLTTTSRLKSDQTPHGMGGPGGSHATSSVLSAGAPSSQRECAPSTAGSCAVADRVVRVLRLPRRSDVYDIGVPGGGEFVAGGIVVHNCDEIAAWRYLQQAWDMLQMGLRLGEHPRGCVTTTPRPLPLIKELVKDERVHTVRGSTYDNLHNLAPTFRRAVLDRYAGTTLGRQELDAEILEDLPGAMVRRADIDHARVDRAPELDLVVVAVDPAGTGTGDEAGIVVVGRGADDGHAYVLADYSGQLTAQATGEKAWRALEEHGAAYLVYEDNFGKQWLRDGLADAYRRLHPDDPDTPAKRMRKVTAQHGKKLRAQPVAMRYEQGRVHHMGTLALLEDQLTTWNPDDDHDSPDRIDALVHGVTDLLRREAGVSRIVTPHARGIGPSAAPRGPLSTLRGRTR